VAISQKGARYDDRAHIRDQHVLNALDDLASQLQAIRTQGVYGEKGAPSAPSTPQSISVAALKGFGTVAITHNNAPAGTQYTLQYSSSPSFASVVEVDNGSSLSWQQYLKGHTFFFRARARFSASDPSPWVYYGTQANPTPVTF
jgi:hypothetical protein